MHVLLTGLVALNALKHTTTWMHLQYLVHGVLHLHLTHG